LKLLVSALEASANLHLEEIMHYLHDAKLLGIFDDRFSDTPLYNSSEFGVMGIIGALKVYKKAKKALNELVELAIKEADVVVMIDSPAFNVPFAKALRKAGYCKKIVYYVLPQVWAWKKKRVSVVESLVDELFCILPFESKFWNRATYVGNPLMDEIKHFKDSNVLKEHAKSFAFLPGSRRAEIRSLMDDYRQVASELKGEKTLVVHPMYKENIEELYGDVSMFTISCSTHDSLYKSDFAFICSGTATLEAAIIAIPFVLVYKAKRFDYFIGRLFVKLPYIGLANLIAYFDQKPPMHPELIQEMVTPKNILKAYDEIDLIKFSERAVQLRKDLKSAGTSERCAKIIKGLV
jgi:lipid-A-disaccharide synthase